MEKLNIISKEYRTGTIQAWLDNDMKVANSIIEKHSDINTDHDWYDFVYGGFIEDSSKLGFNIEACDIQFSGFCSQGDGASFIGDVSIVQYLRGTKQLSSYKSLRTAVDNDYIDDLVFIERNSSYYSHENTCSLEEVSQIEYERMTDLMLEQISDIENELEATRLELCKDLYKRLEEAYNYLTSRETIIETLASNEYEFDEYLEIQ